MPPAKASTAVGLGNKVPIPRPGTAIKAPLGRPATALPRPGSATSHKDRKQQAKLYITSRMAELRVAPLRALNPLPQHVLIFPRPRRRVFVSPPPRQQREAHHHDGVSQRALAVERLMRGYCRRAAGVVSRGEGLGQQLFPIEIEDYMRRVRTWGAIVKLVASIKDFASSSV